jgi:hypothetical protein
LDFRDWVGDLVLESCDYHALRALFEHFSEEPASLWLEGLPFMWYSGLRGGVAFLLAIELSEGENFSVGKAAALFESILC